MAILPIVQSPDPLLKQKSIEVDKVDREIQKLMDDMLETMYEAHGAGLAAVQVGVLKRILVMDVNYEIESCEGHDHEHNHKHIVNTGPMFMVNPKITQISEQTSVLYEGCLSFPEIRADIERPKEVVVEYLDYYGEPQILQASGFLATCVQHEIDHLNGITFVDHLSRLKKEMLLRKLKKKGNKKK